MTKFNVKMIQLTQNFTIDCVQTNEIKLLVVIRSCIIQTM